MGTYPKTLFRWAIALGVFYLFLKFLRPLSFGPWKAYQLFGLWIISPLQALLVDRLLAPYIYLALGVTLLLESLIPVAPEQKIFSVSFFQDLVWLFYETILNAVVVLTYVEGLRWIYHSCFSFLSMETVGAWPYWVRFASGVLLLDFLMWLQHYLNHKVSWLWKFHALHHSQREMNFFTDFRYHVFEYLIRYTILVIPFLIFPIKIPVVIVFSIVAGWYTRFYHGNIRTHLGPLRHVLVTPQSHRVHHSSMPQHQDRNFGSLFTIWDQVFNTQYWGYTEYPETGIKDSAFPHEQSAHPVTLLFMPLRQLIYPIAKIADNYWGTRHSAY